MKERYLLEYLSSSLHYSLMKILSLIMYNWYTRNSNMQQINGALDKLSYENDHLHSTKEEMPE